MRVSKVSLAVILAMIFSASARSQDSNSKAVGKHFHLPASEFEWAVTKASEYSGQLGRS